MKVHIQSIPSDAPFWTDAEWNEWFELISKQRPFMLNATKELKRSMRLFEIGRRTNLLFMESYWASGVILERWPEVLDDPVIENRKWFSDEHGIINRDKMSRTRFCIGHSNLDHKEFYVCKKNSVRSFVMIISNYVDYGDRTESERYEREFEKAGFTKCLPLYSLRCTTFMIKANERSEFNRRIKAASDAITAAFNIH